MPFHHEQKKVLEAIQQQYDVEKLLEWGIPYSRILEHIRDLVKDGYLEVQGGKVILTELGIKVKDEQPEASKMPSKSDPLAQAKTKILDPAVVVIPTDEVK